MFDAQSGVPEHLAEPGLFFRKRHLPVRLIIREPNRVVLEAEPFAEHGI